MAEEKILNLILEELQGVKHQITNLEQRIDARFNSLVMKVDRNYDLMLSFYGKQQEYNTYVQDRLNIITGQLEMHNNQLALNTSKIKQFHLV